MLLCQPPFTNVMLSGCLLKKVIGPPGGASPVRDQESAVPTTGAPDFTTEYPTEYSTQSSTGFRSQTSTQFTTKSTIQSPTHVSVRTITQYTHHSTETNTQFTSYSTEPLSNTFTTQSTDYSSTQDTFHHSAQFTTEDTMDSTEPAASSMEDSPYTISLLSGTLTIVLFGCSIVIGVKVKRNGYDICIKLRRRENQHDAGRLFRLVNFNISRVQDLESKYYK